jgi:hypothetical protein
MKKIWLVIITSLPVISIPGLVVSLLPKGLSNKQGGIETFALIHEGDFHIYQDGRLQKTESLTEADTSNYHRSFF